MTNLNAKGVLLVLAAGWLGFVCPAKAEQFNIANGKSGKIVHQGGQWIEYPPYDGTHYFSFVEQFRFPRVITLFDASRSFVMRLPTEGGPGYWWTPGRSEWVKWYDVSYTP